MRHVLRNTGLLLSTLTLAATAASISAADAAVSQNPPKGCASTEGYGNGESVWAKATVCFTEREKPGLYGGQTLEPTDVLTGACSKAGVVFWDKTPCAVSGKLTLRKDGVFAWTESRSLRSDPIHGLASGEAVDFYACRGRGEYSLTLHDASASVRYKATKTPDGKLHSEYKTVQLPDVTVKAVGC
jgi:hypothetical protein